MRALFMIVCAYGFIRMLNADTLHAMVAYGALFSFSGAFVAFCDELTDSD